MDAKNGAREQQMASKDEQKGAHEPAMAAPGKQKTSKETKDASGGAMERPNGAPNADWRRKASKHGSSMGAKRCQERVEIRDPGEVENRAPAAARAQFSA